ncbi:TonB-dependent receptor [Caminibacter pacificus]|uniref:Iron complex outermembrane receptor protein n=1 Tax=Caminibacter pacificus TaxID=1424653 RepID=A0AAJ4RCN4_9BACT|nr:TonB-dependent receptor [Caminibacter pacificus]QCI27910.1 hypothetical protein C6V80_02685 [Caminibacter pacificus]ROR39912.1 iron complex outermembrane receptor protein [Caminibacter pacificus]
MRLLSFLLFFSILFAGDLNMLLNKIEKSEDLSKKTMQESAGISYVITRYQLDMMQAKYLSDVLKHTIIGYGENRYGITDPWNSYFIPYNTVGVRIFLDNQELTTAKYDNALFLYSKIDLSFIDHIEIYYMSPTYELSPEPAYIIIKLYSKDAKRDEGTRIATSYGTFKSNSQVVDFANSGKYNVYTHFSRDYIGHKTIPYKDTLLNRDSLTYHYLLSVYNEKTRYLLSTIFYKQHSFLGLSVDGNIKKSLVWTKYLHFGIDHKFNDNFTFKYSLDYTNDKSVFAESPTPVFYSLQFNIPLYDVLIKGIGKVHTTEFVYKKTTSKNKFVTGVSARFKRMDYPTIKLNSYYFDYEGVKRQDIYTAFMENNYQYLKNAILTLGAAYSIYESDNINDRKLKQYKIGNTYLLDKNDVFKLFFYHYEFGIPPYLISTLLGDSRNIEPQKTNVFIFKYKRQLNSSSNIEGIYMYAKHSNYLLFTKEGLQSIPEPMKLKIFNVRYHKNYNIINDFVIDASDMILEDAPIKKIIRIIFLNTHRIKKFDLFESLVFRYSKFGDSSKRGYDLNGGVKYNVNDNFSISLKAQNILNKRYENGYLTIDMNTQERDVITTPLLERSITLSVEYMF